MMIKYFFILVLLGACAKVQKKADESVPADFPSYSLAVESYLKSDYESAYNQIVGFMKTKPHSTRYKEAVYLKGKILKQLQKTQECIDTFSEVTEITKISKDTYYAYSLYFSGICHEMKGDIPRAIATYQDALKSPSIPRDLKELEIPARLAIAYSRVGETMVSKRYYDKTKKELHLIKKAKHLNADRKQALSEILFNMGTLTQSFSTGTDFENYLNSVRLAQEYLVLVLKLDSGSQSHVAVDMMLNNFKAISEHIENLPLEDIEDVVLAQRQRQESRKKLSHILIESIEQFESLTLPEQQQGLPHVISGLEKTKEIKIKLENIIMERPIGEGLTPEAEKLNHPKIKGRIYDKKTGLESE